MLLQAAGVCCTHMDDGTPDDDLFVMAEVVECYRRYGV